MIVAKKISVNGLKASIEAHPEERLLDVVRGRLNLTGTKEGCGEGECGACSVLLNGDAVNSCLVLFGQLKDGDSVTTVEGLANESHLEPLRARILRNGGVQCGFCSPGMLIAAHALLSHNPNPSREEIAAAIAGNLCRCSGYASIIEAIAEAQASPIAGGER